MYALDFLLDVSYWKNVLWTYNQLTWIDLVLGSLFLVLVFNLVMGWLAYVVATDYLTDLSYSASYLFILGYLVAVGKRSPLFLVVGLLLLLWAARLGGYLLVRILKLKKDPRLTFLKRSFVRTTLFFVAQACIAVVLMVPIILLYAFVPSQAIVFGASELFYALEPTAWLGAGVVFLGWLLESVADYQKFNFKSLPANKGKAIKTGLYTYIRYPNYLGEIMVWLGFALMAYVYLIPQGLLAYLCFVSPFLITCLLLFVTGIPQQEAQKERNSKKKDTTYPAYKKATNKLIPYLF